MIRIVSDILRAMARHLWPPYVLAPLPLWMQVQITKPVSGIAMGLISENKGQNHAILSDILGDEDHPEIWTSR